ncbi:hypothetical protein D7Y13_07475 [Corallococcus praedator]|uniref:Peptidoglycan-binding protein n=1 Tax=Corallococcus praedator TaxID=2316724 RepID=A0ABX9QMI0_9BACT|nr:MULTISPECIES: hypothetical protein [Corallococcus]RKH32984.1 hypothetical protein D7X75_13665 [Corallococcus sp. CA031C]RKI13542.1 hypothetical protein D7Y13_07475 [Corallococcus praedator]
MSWSINVPATNTLDLALGDAAHGQAVCSAEAGVAKAIPLPGGSVSLKAALRVPVELFNGQEDADAHGVIGRATGNPDGTEPEPLFTPDGAACWLKYAAELNAQASGEGSFPFVALSGSGAVNVLVADYRRHAPTRTLGDALRDDVKSLRLPFLLEDVQALVAGDALSFQTRIQLKAGLTLSWPAVTSTVVASLARRVGGQVALQLKAEVGASLSGELKLEDELRLVFSRAEGGGAFQISIRKAITSQVSAGMKVGVTLDVASPVLAALLGAVADTAQAQSVSKIVEGLDSGTLGTVLVPVATSLFGALGFKQELDGTLATVKQVHTELKRLIEDGVVTALQAGFEYEYARTAGDATLMALEVPADELGSVHAALISGDLASIQRRTKDAWVRRYFHMRTTGMQRTRGFGLGWRDMFLAKVEDRKQLKAVTQHASRDHAHGPRRYAFQGTRSYQHEGWLAGNKVLQGIDFNAQMPAFSTRPSADAFDYAFFAQSRVEGSLSLQELADQARVWGALRDDASVEPLSRLFQSVPRGTRVTARFEARLDAATFRKVLRKMGTDPEVERQAFAVALARALPRDSVASRESPSVRQKLYTPLWNTYLLQQGKGWSKEFITNSVGAHLKKQLGAGGLVAWNWEQSRHSGGGPTAGTFMGVMEGASKYGGDTGGQPYGNIFVIWQRLTHALQDLQQAIDARSPLPDEPEQSIIARAFEPLEDAGSNPFRLTATVAWLVELARHWGFRDEVQPLLGLKVGEQEELLLTAL